jgi:uncharacterized membrane protein YoaT (DUF817 family)
MKMSILHNKILQFLALRDSDSKSMAFLREMLCFAYKEAISCVFPAFIFLMLGISHFVSIPGIPRYDFLLLMCFLMQIALYKSGLESKHELLVICAFHLLGVTMEIVKVNNGAWTYPDFAYSKLMGVPLFSGFMYASVASYICQAWRNFDLKMNFWPSTRESSGLAVLIYGNFYSNLYIADLRVFIIPLLMVAFKDTWVEFTTNGQRRKMPMLLSFILIAFFIWLGENICTLLGAWAYPHQMQNWSVVRFQIMTSWFLLVIVSVIIVALLKRIKHNMDLASS